MGGLIKVVVSTRQRQQPLVVTLCCLSTLQLLVDWGTQATHPLPPSTVANMLRDNGFQKQAADTWVAKNVSSHNYSGGVDIRYIAVGNEPSCQPTMEAFWEQLCLLLETIQSALTKAGLSTRVKVTVPLNADVYESPTNLPSDGNFRSDIHDLILLIVKFLSDNEAPFTVNIYPFISLYIDPNFPLGFAFFGNKSFPLNDGGTIYDNVFDAHCHRGKGTPLRPGYVDAFLFSLIDEDAKSIQPGIFERHWGLFYPGMQSAWGRRVQRFWYQQGPSVSYDCANAGCTGLGYGTSCEKSGCTGQHLLCI
ncbi:hypothetical protein OIU84_009689 [Salix udensis]|uniref:glucan endo-1,3-beta-D-glucosidase n=1 Tax=Salix udensis TaxID=889485 RepID=A0AAD6JKB0_9ROSI|nr:hypothetical protein OIU84_009689 [Salix udensis]